MKKILVVIMAVAFCMFLIGCSSTIRSSYRLTTNLEPIPAGDNLYYDVQTKIVYIMFGHAAGTYQGYGYMSAYYAPNGLPYLYDASNQTLVEIEHN